VTDASSVLRDRPRVLSMPFERENGVTGVTVQGSGNLGGVGGVDGESSLYSVRQCVRGLFVFAFAHDTTHTRSPCLALSPRRAGCEVFIY